MAECPAAWVVWAAWAECTKTYEDVSFHEELKHGSRQRYYLCRLFYLGITTDRDEKHQMHQRPLGAHIQKTMGNQLLNAKLISIRLSII